MPNNVISEETLTEQDVMEIFPGADRSSIKKVEPENCFVVKIWLWEEKTQDFSIEKLDKPSQQLFDDYSEAYSLFDTMRKKDLPGLLGSEIKLDLIHYKFGKGHVIYSNILLPGTRH